MYLISFLILASVIIYFLGKRNQLKRMQLEKELALKEELSQIKTKNKLQEQRLEISRDLHDNIGSQLTFIISSLDNLKFISKTKNSKILIKLEEIELGNGLQNMESRIDEIGGAFSISSNRGKGTVIEVRYPITKN